MTTAPRSLRIALVHQELGIGGAERLMVDAALALQARGHRVSLHVAAHDPARSFAATRDGGLDVRVRGGRVPLHIGGRLRLPLAVTRSWLAAGSVFGPDEHVDALLCDGVAQLVPLLRGRGVPLLFYGHYPDALLTPRRTGWYAWYRVPFDRWERAGLETADRLLVNSAFTAAAFRRCFPGLRVMPEVLHPAVDVSRFAPGVTTPGAGTTIAVISRLVAAKNLRLAVATFARLRALVSPAQFAPLRLVIAGGYDSRLRDGADTVRALAADAAALGVADRLSIVRSPDDGFVQALLGRSRAILFTPTEEHFGYVPIEAMAAGRPVIAAAAGGPLETVVDGATGFLRPPTAEAFAEALRRLVEDPAVADRMGAAGRRRAVEQFALQGFGERLEAVIRDVVARRARGLRAPAAAR